MSATAKTTTRRRSTSAAKTTATDTATDTADVLAPVAAADGPAADTAADTPADVPAPDAARDTAADADGAASGARTDDQTGDTADGSADAVVGGAAASWADAVPWLALQVGSRPTGLEVALAVPVWNMLHHAPGTTALRLAADAEARGVALDPSVVTRVLERFARAGIVSASEDGALTRWSPVTPGQVIADAQTAMTASATTALTSGGSRAVRATVGAGTALPPGGLRAAVAAHLSENPYQDWSASQISNALGGRSCGAIAKSLERLVGDRVAVRTSDRPCRYQHAGTDGADPGLTGDTGSANVGADTDRADTGGAVTDPSGEGADGQ